MVFSFILDLSQHNQFEVTYGQPWTGYPSYHGTSGGYILGSSPVYGKSNKQRSTTIYAYIHAQCQLDSGRKLNTQSEITEFSKFALTWNAEWC